MNCHKFVRMILGLLLIIGMGKINAFASYNEAANYKLLESIQSLNVDGVQEALSKGADPNARDPKPAHFKALKILMIYFLSQETEDGRQKIFNISKLLLDHGAKIEPSDNDILFFPIAQGYVPLVKLLLDNGANPFSNVDGKSPMELAVYYKQDKVVNLLKNYGVQDVSALNKAQLNLLKSIENNDLIGITAAIKSGAKLNDLDSSNRTALIQALRTPVYKFEQLLIIKYLLNQGADPNKRGDSGFKDLEGIPIHLAVALNKLSMNEPDKNSDKIALGVMQELIKHGAKVSAMDSRGRTPLHLAAQNDNILAAQLLLESGCRVKPKDALNKTPLDYAESREMISLLKRYGAKESD